MTERDILAEFGIDKEEIEKEVQESLVDLADDDLEQRLDESVRDYNVNTILEGRIVSVGGDEVMVDVGYKSEGSIPRSEWDSRSAVAVGDVVEVLLEAVEDDSGLVQLSKRKADRIRNWERVVTKHDEDDVVTGTVIRKIKGGLLVDIGVPVFLPASQVDIRRPGEIADFIGRKLTCKILKIDQDRRNIVVSRRQLIESQRRAMKDRMFARLEKGQTRPGKVKNILDFGAFVDLGGVDGLLHITDMSWGRISHPSEMVAIDDLIEVMVLDVNVEKERVALGLKQKTPSPWENIEEKYPVGSSVQGEVVNLMSYGAFVKLEEGVEGLVHISEMSWTRRINHPSEVVAIGDMVDIVVLGINKEKEEISLGMKQTEQNPWELVEQNYPSGTEVVGRVRNLTSYGAFVEIEEGIDGLLHVSDMSWTRKISHPSEVVQKGDTIKCIVLEVDPDKRRVALGLKQLEVDPWREAIPARYRSGDLVRGIVTKLTNFGAFVELEDGLEGLLHISELSEKKIPTPEEIVEVGDVVDVRVIRVDSEARKIGLSLRTEGPLAEAEVGPRIVIRSDELQEAENPDEMISEAMEEAPQLGRETVETVESMPTGTGLNIPADIVEREEAPVVSEAELEGAAEPAEAPPEEEAPAEPEAAAPETEAQDEEAPSDIQGVEEAETPLAEEAPVISEAELEGPAEPAEVPPEDEPKPEGSDGEAESSPEDEAEPEGSDGEAESSPEDEAEPEGSDGEAGSSPEDE